MSRQIDGTAAKPALAPQPDAVQAEVSRPRGFPYEARHDLALISFGAALLIIFGTGGYWMVTGVSPGYSGGGAAAAALILIVTAVLLAAPTLIMDAAPADGGEPSTMRLLTLLIVTVFCALVLRTGWNDGTLPTLENQGNWVWLVTAALGGKALQKYAEREEKP